METLVKEEWFCRDFARIGRRWAKLLSSSFLHAPCSFFFCCSVSVPLAVFCFLCSLDSLSLYVLQLVPPCVCFGLCSASPFFSGSAALLLLRNYADGLPLNVATRLRMMLWRKTVATVIAGLSCCRKRKWWIRSTRCHCFNEEEKNSRCWVWTERLPRLKTKLLFMLWKPDVVGGAHAGRLMHAHGAWRGRCCCCHRGEERVL